MKRLIFAVTLLLPLFSAAQDGGLRSAGTDLPLERLYVSFNKQAYVAGDTIWFKTWLMAGKQLLPSAISSKVYVEMISDSNKVIERLVIPQVSGIGTGDLVLSPEKYAGGNYTFRAYTNWMQNFGEDFFFHKSLKIGNADRKSWLLSYSTLAGKGAAGGVSGLNMKLISVSGNPVAPHEFNLRITAPGQTLFNGQVRSTAAGELYAGLPPETGNSRLLVSLQDKADRNQRFTFPVYRDPAEVTDLQFMPEGGRLVAGLLSRMAFKGIGPDGMGRAISGKIVNSSKEEVVRFTSSDRGMGSFYLSPVAGEKYTAQLELAHGGVKEISLPEAERSGTALRVTDPGKDSLNIFITATQDFEQDKTEYLFTARVHDSVYYAATFPLDRRFANIRLPKSLFPTGICHLALSDSRGNWLNERLWFSNRKDQLEISIEKDQPDYRLNDSIALNIRVAGPGGKGVNGSFSLSVTDNSQVKSGAGEDNILSHFLLTGELKGNVEDPGGYFTGNNGDNLSALDDLLLTQGWITYDVKKAAKIAFLPEPDISVSGTLSNVLGKPAPVSNVRLLSMGKNLFVKDTLSDDSGKFRFRQLPLADTSLYMIRVLNRRQKSSSASIKLDEFEPAGDMRGNEYLPKPWNVSADSIMLNNLRSGEAAKREQELLQRLARNSKLLNEVQLKTTKKSVLFQGDFMKEDVRIDEKELIAAKRTTLFDLLYKRFGSFTISKSYFRATKGLARFNNDRFVLNSKLVADFIIDGISVNKMFLHVDDEEKQGMMAEINPSGVGPSDRVDGNAWFSFMSTYLDYLNASDVKDIQLYKHESYYIFAVTTRSGKGPYMAKNTGNVVYRPLPNYIPRDFYRPKYIINQPVDQEDQRAAVHWDPFLLTDENGKAFSSFFAASRPGSYTVRIEGTDMKGHFGFTTKTIVIKSR